MTAKPQFLIGATASGSGKTTLTLGLLRALRNRGFRVQPFKCGPDYLDPKHHAAAAGRESYNLDLFMAPPEEVQRIYSREGENADICVIEGVMGLFDGYHNLQGSSAALASLLDLPVLLVVPARSTAYTVAATLYGFKHFRPEVKIGGVIFNWVNSPTHYASLEQACRDVGIEALGYLPPCPELEIPSRHLGLNIDSDFCFEDFAERVARQVEKTVRIERLLQIASCPFTGPQAEVSPTPVHSLRIAIARDEAFNFTYAENLHALARHGNLVFFSPLHDKALPPADFVYLPGGYPELHLPELSANESMRQSIRRYCEHNGKLLAECGGMMYLCETIRDKDGTPYPVCGFLPRQATMENMKLHLGYRNIKLNGHEFRGHEFHYSRLLPEGPELATVGKITNARGTKADTLIYRKQQVVASYIHFYRAGQGSLLDIAEAVYGNNQDDCQ